MKSTKIPSILVAVDGSKFADKAFEYACELSIMRNIPIIIVNVVEEYATVGHSILRELKKSSKRMLHEYKGRAETLDIRNARTIQCVGNAAEEILKMPTAKIYKHWSLAIRESMEHLKTCWVVHRTSLFIIQIVL